MSGDLILYQFSRPAVLEGDFSDFLHRFGEERLPKGRKLAGMMNNMLTFVHGYDHDPREVYAIPEVRKFYSDLTEACPTGCSSATSTQTACAWFISAA